MDCLCGVVGRRFVVSYPVQKIQKSIGYGCSVLYWFCLHPLRAPMLLTSWCEINSISIRQFVVSSKNPSINAFRHDGCERFTSIFLSKFPFGENSSSAKFFFGEKSLRQNILSAKFPFGEISFQRKIRSAKILAAKFPSAKIPWAKFLPTTHAITTCAVMSRVSLCNFLLGY